MKIAFLALLLSGFFAATSQAAINYDGCYQLYMPSTMYPVFCLDGTNEEGINGAGVRLVIFHTNTNMISACAISSSLGGSANSLEFMLGSRKEMILSEVKLVNSRVEGFATFGKTKLNFMKLDQSTSQRLLSNFYAEPKCKNVNMGEIVKLR